jgi:hypothetical protein
MQMRMHPKGTAILFEVVPASRETFKQVTHTHLKLFLFEEQEIESRKVDEPSSPWSSPSVSPTSRQTLSPTQHAQTHSTIAGFSFAYPSEVPSLVPSDRPSLIPSDSPSLYRSTFPSNATSRSSSSPTTTASNVGSDPQKRPQGTSVGARNGAFIAALAVVGILFSGAVAHQCKKSRGDVGSE